jgi:hypothetical protein
MAGDPEWELLADALNRVVASGVAKTDAQVAICKAIADRSVAVRLFVGNIEGADVFLFEGWERDVPPSRTPQDFASWESALTGLPPRQPSLMIPRHTLSSKRQQTPLIVPEDFDWPESRPLKPWRDPQASLSFFDWHRHRIYLRSADVARVLVAHAAKTTVEAPDAARTTVIALAPATRAKRKPERAQPSRERAQQAIEALYPNGVPDQTTEPNSILYRKVGEWLKTKSLLGVSNSTILRAAGRRQ